MELNDRGKGGWADRRGDNGISWRRTVAGPSRRRAAWYRAWIAANPAAGDVIEGTGGARKVWFAGKGKGKSGGYRVITFFSGTDVPVFLAVHLCQEREIRFEAQRTKTLLAEIVKTYRSGRESK